MATQDFDGVLLDLSLPDGRGEEIVPDLIDRGIPVAAVSAHFDGERAWRLAQRGVLCLPKPLNLSVLPRIVEALVRARLPSRAKVGALARRFRLSPTETLVLSLASAGLSARDVAGRIGCTASTVASYWSRIRDKTGTSSRREVMALLFDE